MGSVHYLVAPDDDLDFEIDLTAELGADTIASAVWSVDPADSPGVSFHDTSETTTTARAFITGFTAGEVYAITAKITTTNARVYERSLTLRCEDHR